MFGWGRDVQIGRTMVGWDSTLTHINFKRTIELKNAFKRNKSAVWFGFTWEEQLQHAIQHRIGRERTTDNYYCTAQIRTHWKGKWMWEYIAAEIIAKK